MNSKVIKRNMKIGNLDAEADLDFIRSCYVDNGNLEQLLDTGNPTSVVLGRTGSGKSALLLKINDSEEKVKKLDPNNISVKFLEYSDIIQFFNALDVKLDLFYRLLWRHILTIELLNLRYGELGKNGLLERLSRLVDRDPIKKQALTYFSEWGDKFWIDIDSNLKEITERLTRETKAKFGSKLTGIDLSLEGVKSLTSEQKTEFKQRATQVVNSIQIKQLNDVLDLLGESVFDDSYKKFYILIDQLDEDWANTETRCRFIRALIEEIKNFRKVPNIKIIIAIRRDLLDLVFSSTRDYGFQEDKYESYLLPLKWNEEELSEIVTLRINELFKSKYTNENISIDDIFPKPNGGQTAMDYMLERTLRRPRDILQFVNTALDLSSGRDKVNWRSLKAAEATYSVKRLNSLKEEWDEIYPSFNEIVEILRRMPPVFTRSQLNENRLNDLILSMCDRNDAADDCVIAAKHCTNPLGEAIKVSDVALELFRCFYRTGVIGVKTSTLDTYIWSHIDQPTVNKGEVKRSNHIKVHKMLHRALDIQE